MVQPLPHHCPEEKSFQQERAPPSDVSSKGSSSSWVVGQLELPMQKASILLIGLFCIEGPAQAALSAQAESVVWRAFADEQYGTRVQYPSRFSVVEGRPE